MISIISDGNVQNNAIINQSNTVKGNPINTTNTSNGNNTLTNNKTRKKILLAIIIVLVVLLAISAIVTIIVYAILIQNYTSNQNSKPTNITIDSKINNNVQAKDARGWFNSDPCTHAIFYRFKKFSLNNFYIKISLWITKIHAVYAKRSNC